MAGENTDTFWIDELKCGSSCAAEELWDRYFERLVGFARSRLQNVSRRVADEEDVALSAFHSFCRGAAAGRFAKLEDSNDLRHLLFLIATRKASRQVDRLRRAKRGGGRVQGESVFEQGAASECACGIGQVIDRQPTPEIVALLEEESQRLLESLGDESLKQITLLKMEGYTNKEVAQKRGCKLRTVERKLRLIRQLWAHEECVDGR